jgi:hypothetical protein
MLVGKEKMLSFLKKITVGQVQVEMVAGMVAVQVYGMAQMTIAVEVVVELQILELLMAHGILLLARKLVLWFQEEVVALRILKRAELEVG